MNKKEIRIDILEYFRWVLKINIYYLTGTSISAKHQITMDKSICIRLSVDNAGQVLAYFNKMIFWLSVKPFDFKMTK